MWIPYNNEGNYIMMNADFDNFIKKQIVVPKKQASHFLRWIDHFLHFCNLIPGTDFKDEQIEIYLNHIEGHYKDWQIQQAKQAIQLYRLFLRGSYPRVRKSEESNRVKWKYASEKMIRMLRLKHRSFRTEQSYKHYLRQFFKFIGPVDPYTLTDYDLQKFLSYLAVERCVARSTQNIAFNALLFFYRHALECSTCFLRSRVVQ